MTVRETEAGWIVARDGETAAGPFTTSAEAWRWADRHEGEPISRAEQFGDWVSASTGGDLAWKACGRH